MDPIGRRKVQDHGACLVLRDELVDLHRGKMALNLFAAGFGRATFGIATPLVGVVGQGFDALPEPRIEQICTKTHGSLWSLPWWGGV